MKELLITDEEAHRLITVLKHIVEDHHGSLHENSTGEILIKGPDSCTFILNYRFSARKKTFNFRENNFNYNLFRINLNNSFHKNANGEKIKGNRINIFSSEEYYSKADGTTYQKAYHLPYNSIRNSDDFFEVLEDLLQYTNTNNSDRIKLQSKLF